MCPWAHPASNLTAPLPISHVSNMAIQYAPQSGSIILCDYGGIIPEMTKRRPVVVVASVSDNLCMVVPLSTTPPKRVQPWHVKIELEEPLPCPYEEMTCWAKCDMVSSVAFFRLNLLRGGKAYGKRVYLERRISEADLEAIRSAIWQAVSFRR